MIGFARIQHHRLRQNLPGILVALLVAVSATFISEHYGGPVMLYALLLGMAFHFMSETPTTAPGIGFSSRHILHVGVALLGARISLDHFVELGIGPVATVLAGVGATILFGMMAARLLGLPRNLGLISGGATAICGASAALAVSSILPQDKQTEQQTLFTIIAVTTLSTLCMILYPLLVAFLGFDDWEAGILLGATIHDVAQVVGAGYIISPEAGDSATMVKLLRVAMLVPVCLILAAGLGSGSGAGGHTLRVPWFLIAFMLLAAGNSFHLLPETVTAPVSEISRWCLITAIAAIGMKTSLGEFRHLGLKPILLLASETLFLLLVVLLSLWLLNG